MPTPSGKLKAGDVIVELGRTEDEDLELEVVERLGNDAGYSVRVKRADGKRFDRGSATGHLQRIVTEMEYWLRMGQENQHRVGTQYRGGFVVKKADQVRMRQVMAACLSANPDIPRERVRRIVELALAVAKVRLDP